MRQGYVFSLLGVVFVVGCTSPAIERDINADGVGPIQQVSSVCSDTVCGDGQSCIAERCFQGCVFNDECPVGICVEFRNIPGRWCVDEGQAVGHRGFVRGEDGLPEIGDETPSNNGAPNQSRGDSLPPSGPDAGIPDPPMTTPPANDPPPAPGTLFWITFGRQNCAKNQPNPAAAF